MASGSLIVISWLKFMSKFYGIEFLFDEFFLDYFFGGLCATMYIPILIGDINIRNIIFSAEMNFR